ncbi:IS607 family element RNA-guided endonuclease TnpB [Kitasatospora cathayae]|uniref:IS607 family element RNA-guided endonuclease TnpB n=1 Tax=Kitasatospora cathayae TaxID=3004092 RepID=A0ABY7QGW3_9ACTN|nr:IS607 family element RNA-guided endonuclease TnpB [Kitasatospora sp. HUAS 3-15]WBP91970.1 IS607 family element RNA-guided endonuclease TnpB [Kitasatospora sp. HUAS 3-15]
MNCALRQEILRAFRFTLDPTERQLAELARYAGAARWAFNHALAAKVAAHQEWRAQVNALAASGVAVEGARKQVKVSLPNKASVQKAWNQAKGDSRTGADGICPWWHEVNTYCFQSAFMDADAAWKNWLDSLKGARAGRQVGYPRFKKKGRCRDSFRLHHHVSKPGIRLVGYRRLRLPKLGEVRLHDSGKRLSRLIDRGQAVVQSVTVSRGGHRWYASVLVKVQQDLSDKPTRRQAGRGTVGVDLGVKVLAALSQPLDAADPGTALVPNPRHLRHAAKRLAKAQRALARTVKGSARRDKARRRVARLHHEVAVRRKSGIHELTKRLATGFAVVAVENLNVAGMTASARGTVERPGRNVRQKASLNRSILDAAPAEIRRQLTYKTGWYGSKLAVCDRWFPSSKTCSACGWQNPRLTLTDREYHCQQCGLCLDRDINAARNIAAHAGIAPPTAPGRGVASPVEDARGAYVRPTILRDRGQNVMKREDSRSNSLLPPQRSDPLALPPPAYTQPGLF